MSDESKSEPWMETYHAFFFKVMAVYEEWSQDFGINLYEYLVLSYLYDHQERCTHKDLIENRVMPQKFVDSILKQFEQWNVIEFYPNNEDRRGKLIRLTEIGVESAKKAVLGGRELENLTREKLGIEKWEILKKSNLEFLKVFRNVLDNRK